MFSLNIVMHTEETKKKISDSIKHYILTHKKEFFGRVKYRRRNPKRVDEKPLICTVCNTVFISKRNSQTRWFPRICSNRCLQKRKQGNARGNKTIHYKNFRLDSNWELLLAKHLDLNSVEWVQPDAVVWIDQNGKKHKYFPDFYLPKYKVYLDPKNPICILQQKEKLKIVSKQLNLIYGDINFIINEVNKMAGLPGLEPRMNRP